MAASKLAEIYARQVFEGKKKIKDVPAIWRADAQKILKTLQDASTTDAGGEK